MNYKMIFHTIGNLLKVEAGLLVLPLIVSLIYKENTYLSFLIPIAILLVIGFLLTIKKPNHKEFYAREGFLIVGLSWVVISLFGSLPFIISGEIPNFVDAFFETVSGFTTTGASILDDVEVMTKGILFWRSFTHWVGGMGVLVFILAIMPSTDGRSIYILRAESPGPNVGKLVSKVRLTARILYVIYLIITVLEVIFLVCGKMPLYDSIVHSFATAGTGGFSIKNSSIGAYSPYCQVVIGIFMLIFGVNFNVFFLLLIGNFKQVLKSEELFWYLGIVFTSVTIITINLFYAHDYVTTIGETIRHAFFQVSSIITTTGFATTNFDLWPVFSKTILVILMFIGACAGSTGGGMKVSRFVILLKTLKRDIKKLLHPHSVSTIRFEGNVVDEEVVKGVSSYFALLMIIFTACLLIVSIDGFSFVTNFSAVAACINNIGPGLDVVGATGNYAGFSVLSKLTLVFSMLVGRLEIYPMLLLFNPKVWLAKD